MANPVINSYNGSGLTLGAYIDSVSTRTAEWLPTEPPPIIEVPLSSQMTAWPLVPLSQRMSLIPSPLKSPGCGSGLRR